jgi:hypothetical protein
MAFMEFQMDNHMELQTIMALMELHILINSHKCKQQENSNTTKDAPKESIP